MKKLAQTIRTNLSEILNYWDFKCTNATIEGLNNIIQTIKRRSRGFKNPKYFRTMILHVCGKLNPEKRVLAMLSAA